MLSSQVERGIGLGLIVLGVLLFVVFGLIKGAATDVGVYAITAVPLVLGAGLLWRASDANAH